MTDFNSQLLSTLDEQNAFKFSGKVNLLLKDNKQHLGAITIKDGEIIHARYKEVFGLKAISYALIDEVKNHCVKVVVEPEVVDEIRTNVFYGYSDLIRKLKDSIVLYEKTKNLKPLDSLRIFLHDGFIKEGKNVSAEEYDVMCTISDYNRVSEIYKSSELLQHEITSALVNLRKKGAIKVGP